MNAKKIWAMICFLFAGISAASVCAKLRLPDHPTEKLSAGIFAFGFWLLIGLLLWRQGLEQKKPNQLLSERPKGQVTDDELRSH